MNAKPEPKPSALWKDPSPPAVGYDIWLKVELARGLADLDAGRATPIEDVRKEFGLE